MTGTELCMNWLDRLTSESYKGRKSEKVVIIKRKSHLPVFFSLYPSVAPTRSVGSSERPAPRDSSQ